MEGGGSWEVERRVCATTSALFMVLIISASHGESVDPFSCISPMLGSIGEGLGNWCLKSGY